MLPAKLFASSLFCLLVIISATVSRADPVTLTITNPNQALGSFAGSITFFGTITNNTTETYNLGTPGFPLPFQRNPYTYDLIFQPLGGHGVTIVFNTNPGCAPNGNCLDNPNIPTSLPGMSSTGEIPLFTLEFANQDGPFTIS